MTGDNFRHYLFHNPLSSWLLCRWRCQQMLNWNRRVNSCLVNKFLAKYLPKPPGAVVMSYPLSRSPHLSQQLLPLSFSWVKTFEVGWLDSRGRRVNWGVRLEGASAPRSAPTAAQPTPRTPGLPALRMPAEWSPPRAAAAAAATAVAAVATATAPATASFSTLLWLAGRKCNRRRKGLCSESGVAT